MGSIINMSFRDNIKVISSNNIKDTYDIIYLHMEKKI